MKKIFTLVFLLLCFKFHFAATGDPVSGLVTDQQTGAPLTGAVVLLKNKMGFSLSTGTGLDGTFIFNHVPSGKFEIEVRYVSYKKSELHFELSPGTPVFLRIQMSDQLHALKDVTVSAKRDKSNDQHARSLEQHSDQLMNIVSAKAIEISPDITVANVTQRVSGVSIERSNNGEGQYAIIRGMEKRYTYTLIDGFKMPSPDNKNRYIPLDIFPADLISRLEVFKSLSPAQEGDAIAGGINLTLKDAPEHFNVKANLGTSVSQSVLSSGFTAFADNSRLVRSPRILNGNSYNASVADFSNLPLQYHNRKIAPGTLAGLSIGGRSADQKFGALVAVSYQNLFKNTQGIFFQADVDPVTNAPRLTDIISRSYSTQQERISSIGKFDYRINKWHKINLSTAYINLSQNQFRYSSDTSLTLGRTGPGQGRVIESPRSTRNVQKIYHFSVHGEHQLADRLYIDWTGIYSKATANENRTQLSLITGKTLQTDGTVLQQPLTIDALKGKTQTFTYNADQDKAGYLNFRYSPRMAGTQFEFTAGGMYRSKTRNSTYDSYTLGLPLNNSTQRFDGNIDHNTFVVSTLQGTSTDPLNYDFRENVSAGYGQLKFNVGRLQTLAGFRFEHTGQHWTDALPVTQTGKTGSITYSDLLPALNFRFLLSARQNLRATYYSAISRPNFYELIPHSSGDPDADYQEIGNPNLKHATADNYDLRYEFFPGASDQFLAGVFYKRIKDPIEYALVSSGLGYVSQAGNFGTANNYGFELDATRYIRQFGLRANYSFTASKISTTKREDYKDSNGNHTFRTVEQSRSLQGQSKHIANLSFLYKDVKNGVDAQLSGVYTGERINSVSAYLDNDIWQKGFISLDLSAEKKISGNFTVYAKVTNLLNTPYQLFIKLPYPESGPPGASGQAVSYQLAGQNTFIRRDTYQQNYILGLRYKL